MACTHPPMLKSLERTAKKLKMNWRRGKKTEPLDVDVFCMPLIPFWPLFGHCPIPIHVLPATVAKLLTGHLATKSFAKGPQGSQMLGPDFFETNRK